MEERKSIETHLTLLYAVSVGVCQPLEQILDDAQAYRAAQRVLLPKTTLRGEQCEFEPEVRLGAFTILIRSATHFRATATDLNPAAARQLQLYRADLHHYAVASDGHLQRVGVPRRRVTCDFNRHRNQVKIRKVVE